MNQTIPGLKILALGDSYTIGESVAETECWPTQLAAHLGQNGYTVEEPRIIARTGWTTDELWAAIQQDEPSPGYDLVTLLIGVNNQYRGYDVITFRTDFHFLLEKAVHYAGKNPNRVIVISIPDWGVTPFATNRDTAKISAEIDTYNAIKRKETETSGASFLDITPISRLAATQPELIAPDGLHPSGAMYSLWVTKILPCALQILKESRS